MCGDSAPPRLAASRRERVSCGNRRTCIVRRDHGGRTGSVVHQHCAFSVGRCRAEGEQRPSGHAARGRPHGLCAVDAPAQAQSAQSGLVRSRQVRTLGRARFDVALQPAAPNWLRPLAGRHQALPAVGEQNARTPRARAYAWRGGHDRSAGAGLRQCRGHGDRRSAARLALQPPRIRSHRPRHVRDSSATATSWRASPRRRPRWPGIYGSAS